MNHFTYIDTVGIQVDLETPEEQREILEKLLQYTHSFKRFYVESKKHPLTQTNKWFHCVYARNRTIATINNGVFRSGSPLTGGYQMKYYVTIKFAGLKTYDQFQDELSQAYLLQVCALLNTMAKPFKLIELDVCIDAFCPFDHILAICTKKSPKTAYYRLTDRQAFSTTTYIEKIDKTKLNQAVLRGYAYDKSYKEQLPFPVTRFEIKLQAKYFRKYGFSIEAISKAFNRYHVLYFADIADKQRVVEKYNAYKSIKRREIIRLGIDHYRLHPNMDNISAFLNTMLTIHNTDPLWISDALCCHRGKASNEQYFGNIIQVTLP